MTDEVKEQIKLETEILRYFVLIGVALGGGTMGMLASLPTGIRLLLAGLGIIATMAIVYVSWKQYVNIRTLIGGTP
jgi:hypothetical protein